MNGPATAREALIVEALGEVALLLDRVDAQVAAMEAGRKALGHASDALNGQLRTFETRMTSVTQLVQTRAVEHILRRSSRAMSDAIDAQARAMEAAARTAFSGQVDSKLTRLTIALERANQRAGLPWEHWLALVATGVVLAAVTWLIASSMTFRC